MSPTAREILWSLRGRNCVMTRVDGRFELHLVQNGRTVRLETSPAEADARRKAAEWRAAAERDTGGD